MKCVIFGAATLALAGATFAAEPQASTSKTAAATTAAATGNSATNEAEIDLAKKDEKNDPNRMVCVREKVTGSRVRTAKTCMTAAQWAQAKVDARQQVDKIQSARWKSN